MFRSSTAVTRAAAAGTTITGTAPAGLVIGDLLLAFVAYDGVVGDSITPPANDGWVSLGSGGWATATPDGGKYEVFAKIAASSNSYVFTTTAANNAVILVGAWAGRHTITPIRFAVVTNNTTGNATPISIALLGGIVQKRDDIAVFAALDATVGTDVWVYAPPATYTERQDSSAAQFASATLDTFDNVITEANTGTLTVVGTRSSGTGVAGWGGIVVAIMAADPGTVALDIVRLAEWRPQAWDFPLDSDLRLDDFLPATTPSGAISGTATITFGQSGDLKGAGALGGAAAITFGQTGTLRGAGAVAGTTTITFGQSGTLLGAGALAGTTAITFGQSGALVGAGSLSGSASFTFNASATADTPSGAISGTATITFSQSGTLTGSGDLAGSATIVFGASGTLTDASAPAAPARTGGDDVPRHKRVEIYEKPTKRHRITLERDRDLSQELAELFRSLTGDPQTRAAAVEIIKPVRDSLPLESLQLETIAAEILARKLVDIEIALRMLDTERREAVRRREDDEHETTAIELLLSNIL